VPQRRFVGLFLVAALTFPARGAVKLMRLTSTELEYQEFTPQKSHILPINDLELWNGMPKDVNPEGWWWQEEPDFKVYLVSEGLARVRDRKTANQALRDAEDQAKSAGKGMWHTVTEPPKTTTTIPNSAADGSVVSATASVAPTEPLTATTDTTAAPGPLTAWTPSIKQVIATVVGFVGGWQILVLVWAYFHRHRVFLVLLGEPNTGKSWLWHRLVDPTISASELRKIVKSDVPNRLKHAKLPMGKYEIVPVYSDIPGNRAGEQLTQLIDRKWFRAMQRLIFPQRRVWLILLAPSTDSVTRGVSSLGEIDKLDLQRQLGALKLYVSVLASRKTPKPDFVAICVAKVDYFMTNAPEDTTSRSMRDELLSVFKDHIIYLETACKEQEVKHVTIVCSALTGWGSQRILEALKRACYTG
jgi:Staphylococcal nuclease homologue